MLKICTFLMFEAVNVVKRLVLMWFLASFLLLNLKFWLKLYSQQNKIVDSNKDERSTLNDKILIKFGERKKKC